MTIQAQEIFPTYISKKGGLPANSALVRKPFQLWPQNSIARKHKLDGASSSNKGKGTNKSRVIFGGG
jgi:hypothetical protein